MKAVLYFALLVTSVDAYAQPANEPCTERAAVCLVNEGVELLSRTSPDPRRAAEKLSSAFALEPATATLALYATALSMDNQHVRARETWERVIADLEKQERTEETVRQLDAARLRLIEEKRATVRVRLTFPSAEPPDGVTVTRSDGTPINDWDSDPIIIARAGETLTVSYEDGTTTTVPIRFPSGLDEDVRLVTVPERPRPPHKRSKAVKWLSIGLGAGALASAGLSIAYYISASHAYDNASALGCSDGHKCVTGSEGAAYYLDSERKYDVAQGAGIAAGVLAAAAVTFVIVDHVHDDDGPRSASVQVAPVRGGSLVTFVSTF